MEILLFRAVFASCLVLLVSIAARKLGPRVGGRLLGAPMSTGPFLVLVWVSHGTGFAAQATRGCVTGTLVGVCFCFAHAHLAPRTRPVWTLLIALGCGVVAGLAGALCQNVWLTAGLVVLVVVAGLVTVPVGGTTFSLPKRARAWELSLRMALSGLIVSAAVSVAGVVGSFVGGVLSAVPVLLAIMAFSLHRTAGAQAAADLAQGAMGSMIGTLGFLLVLNVALVPVGPVVAFALALVVIPSVEPLLRRLHRVRRFSFETGEYVIQKPL